MTFSLSQVAAMLGCDPPPVDAQVRGWSIDSRTVQAGDLFIALRGENHDGHDFIPDAMARGAVAVIAERAAPSHGLGFTLRPDTQAALEALGRAARAAWGGTVVGVTGSAGKTTTKDNIAALLGAGFAVGKTVGNLNNHIGVPLSILRLPGEAKIGVIEMGMNHAGEIRHLCTMARPDFGVVTNVGYAHVENFGDGIEGVAAAKRELIEALPATGTAVLNQDDPRVRVFPHSRVVTFGIEEGASLRAVDVDLRADGSAFAVEGVRFETSMTGRHGVLNILAALAVARELGLRLAHLVDAVRALSAGKMRGERSVHHGVTLINDAYNSNPAAARAMIDVLGTTPARRRIAVLGEMLELGEWAETLHREVGEYAAARGIDVLIGVRGAAEQMVLAARAAGVEAQFFASPAEAGRALRSIAQAGDAVLFKGSRGTRVEVALQAYVEAAV